MKNRVNNFNDGVYDFVSTNKYIKIGGIVILSCLGVYCLSLIMKLCSHTILSYKCLVNSIKA